MEENSTDGQYAVTLDANGGTLQGYGNASQTTKMVTYGENYGTLPIPTRPGYTFVGWNGKNLYNISNYPSWSSTYKSNGVTTDNNDWITINTTEGQRWNNYWTYNLDLTENTMYTIVLEVKETSNLTGKFYLTSKYLASDPNQFDNTIIENQYLTNNNIIIRNLSTTNNSTNNAGLRTYYDNVNNNSNERLTFRISVLEQQEISSADFQYEPYYITSSTEVVQNQNHTLTAIWVEN